MPIISPQARPSITQSTESFQYPKKTIEAASTGADYGKSEDEVRQPEASVETKEQTKEATLSPQLTALARKEQKIRQQEQALKQEKEAIVAEKAKYGKYAELKAKIEAKDYSALDELGVSYEEWTNYLINKGTPDPNAELIKKLQTEIEELKTNQKTTVDKQYEATVAQYKRDISKTVETNDKFKGIKTVEAEEHVLQHILDTFEEDGEVLTIEEACQDVLDILKDEALKLKALVEEPKEIAPEPKKQTLPPPKSGLRSLTNQISQAAPSQPRNQFQHLSPKDRLAAAIAKAQKAQQR